jgi:hypothetical protein
MINRQSIRIKDKVEKRENEGLVVLFPVTLRINFDRRVVFLFSARVFVRVWFLAKLVRRCIDRSD